MRSPPLQVLQIGPYPPPHGGVQTNLVAIFDYLRTRGIDCRVINLTRHRQLDTNAVYFPHSALRTLALILGLPRDVIHIHIGGNPTFRLLVLGLICCSLPGTKTVLTFHSGGYPTSPSGLAASPRSLIGFVFRRFDRLIGVGPALTTFFVRQLGAAPTRVRLIQPHALLSEIPAITFPDKMEKFFASHRPVMISMGWFEPEYDFALQIRSLGPVREMFPSAGLIILGEGRLGTNLRAQAAATSYAADVMMPGDVPHELALAALARSDIFLRTTLYDGDSISLREALHYGTPVIASDNGMRPAKVRLIPKENLAALVEAIIEVAGEGKLDVSVLEADEKNICAVYELYQEIIGRVATT